jgi:hypothetical protein
MSRTIRARTAFALIPPGRLSRQRPPLRRRRRDGIHRDGTTTPLTRTSART